MNTREILTSYGLKVVGNSPDKNFVEIVELPEHPWFLASQFHPEFKSKPLRPHPIFVSFIGAALEHKARGTGQDVTGKAKEVRMTEGH